MKLLSFLSSLAVSALAAAALGLTPSVQAAPAHHVHPLSTPSTARPMSGGNWTGTVTVTPQGTRVLGNPQAKLKLVEFVSYTCPHCAHFEEASAAQLKLVFVAGGQGSIEVRHILRDPVDLAIALLTNCVPASRFFQLHEAFMRHQDRWVEILQGLNETQQNRWTDGDKGGRMRAIASDLRFYDFVEPLGLTRTAADRCLSDNALMERLAGQTRDAATLGVESTPSFAIGDLVLAGTHDWATLGPQLAARM